MANNNSSYQLPVVDTISTAWEKVSGAKGSVWAAFGLMLLIMFVLGFIQGLLEHVSPFLGFAVNVVFSIINMLLQVGLIYIGITRAFGKPITYRLMFSTFNTQTALYVLGAYILKFLIVLPAVLLVMVAVFLGAGGQNPAVCFIIGGVGAIAAIYLSIRLYITLGFVLDKGLGPIEAIKSSFRATRHNVLSLIGLALLQMLIFIVAVIPLGIGLIWAIPLGLIIYGTVYKRLSSS